MRRYTYAVAEPVVRLLSALPWRDRDLLLKAFSALPDNPFQRADHFVRISGERDVQVKRFGIWLVSFWVDHGNCEVRILTAEFLGR